MKLNEAKAKLLAGQPAFGYALELGSPIAAEALATTGVDFILLDTQFLTSHLAQFGAVEVPQRRYHRMLEEALEGEAQFWP